MGALRISANGSSEGQRDVAAIWSTEHAMAWHPEEAFRRDPAGWAAAKCQRWDSKEARLPAFLQEIPDCPCTLSQARADFGRFHGLGEYLVLGSKRTDLIVQGRTSRARLLNGEPGAEANVTGLSAVAMRENNSDVVEVRFGENSQALEVLLNQKALNFSEQTWMDLNGLFLYSSPGQNVTVMFSSGAGVEVSGHGGKVLSLTVLLPETFQDQTEGLFGRMNGRPQDDLTLPNGTALDVASSGPQEHFAFGAEWAISNATSLFTYDTQELLDKFVYGPKHHPSFLPSFSPPGDANETL
ncbi:Sushi domain-containing protein 2, partial [Ophiophagus hannah]